MDANVWSPEARQLKFALTARFAAELLNNTCTAVFFPRENYLVSNDDSLSDRLRTFATLDELHSGDEPPVPVIEDDDPRLAKIVAEARSRWPEFVDAFQHRMRGDSFLVKAPFGDGENCEWMWLEVKSIEDGNVTGP